METPANLEVLLDVPVRLTVELGSCQMPMREVLQLAAGSVVQLDKLAEAPVDLYVNQKKIAQGEVVVIEDRLGLRLTRVLGAEPVTAQTARAGQPSPLEQPQPPTRGETPAPADTRSGIKSGQPLGSLQP